MWWPISRIVRRQQCRKKLIAVIWIILYFRHSRLLQLFKTKKRLIRISEMLQIEQQTHVVTELLLFLTQILISLKLRISLSFFWLFEKQLKGKIAPFSKFLKCLWLMCSACAQKAKQVSYLSQMWLSVRMQSSCILCMLRACDITI